MSRILFGTAGRAESFAQKGYKKMSEVPAYLREFGLHAYEYQCGHGVRYNEAEMHRLAQNGAGDITFSIHAPYYISMSSLTEETRLNSVSYILQSAEALRILGGRRIIFHPGSCGKQSRETALALAMDTMRRIVKAMDEAGYGDMTLCPEVMGKINQLGTLEEVLALCSVDERILPCVDFGHLNARTLGGLAEEADFAKVLDTMENRLGKERAAGFHAHFSKIEYTKGGEKQHLTFADTQYGPQFEPLLEQCVKRGFSPTIICESAGTQAEDAQTMQAYYNKLIKVEAS